MRQVTTSTRRSLRHALSVFILSVVLPLAVFARIVPGVTPANMNISASTSSSTSVAPCTHVTITMEQVLEATGSIDASELPSRLFLDQNYPNPFNPSTMIRYGLPAGSNVKLSVHSLLGTQIKVVLEGWHDAGTYTLDLSAHDLPSGVYFYRLQTELGTLTRRMTISK
jgi:Secretion system C-terminal sorting domain